MITISLALLTINNQKCFFHFMSLPGEKNQKIFSGIVSCHAFTDDLTKYHFTKSYDLVMTFATLCFVEKDKWRHFIEDAKEHTNPNGIHIIHTFTNTVPASPDIAPFAVGLADEGEIANLYSDWEVLQFKTYVFDDEHPGVPRHQHAVNKLVARKKAF